MLGRYSETVAAYAYIECYDSRCMGGNGVHFFEFPIPKLPGPGVECSIPGGKTQPVQNGGTSGAASPSDFHCANEKDAGPPPRCGGTGNPCNPATGNKYQTDEDYRSGDGALSFVRSYNSFVDPNTGLGKGWIMKGQRRLEILNNASLKIRQGNGRGETFTKNTAGLWRGDADTALALVQNAAGYTLTHRDNSVERYDTLGKLVAETDASGRVTNYSYDINERLTTVMDAFGHTLSLGYDASNHIVTVQDAEASHPPIKYSYDSTGNLIQVSYPDATAKLYHYENASFSNYLTGISYATVNPDGSLSNVTRYSTYAYDPTGKAITTQHATTDNAGPQEKFTLAYDSDTQTTVTDPVNVKEIMTFQVNLGVKNLVNKVSVKPTTPYPAFV